MNAKKVTNNFRGVIIEESLKDKGVLKEVNILSTEIEPVTAKHNTPWLKQWTLYTVEISAKDAPQIAKKISTAINSEPSSWYADFKNHTHHYIIFPDKVFFVDRRSEEQYDEAKEYGISLGIPPYQVDFHPEVIEWKR